MCDGLALAPKWLMRCDVRRWRTMNWWRRWWWKWWWTILTYVYNNLYKSELKTCITNILYSKCITGDNFHDDAVTKGIWIYDHFDVVYRQIYQRWIYYMWERHDNMRQSGCPCKLRYTFVTLCNAVVHMTLRNSW